MRPECRFDQVVAIGLKTLAKANCLYACTFSVLSIREVIHTQVPDFTSAAINHQGWVCGIDIEIDVPKPRILTASEIPELQVEVSCVQASLDIPIPTAAPGYVASPGATDKVDTI